MTAVTVLKISSLFKMLYDASIVLIHKASVVSTLSSLSSSMLTNSLIEIVSSEL